MTKKEIEDFINIHRVYPREYKGRRDVKIINSMNRNYIYHDGYITCQQGEINDAGNFVITKEVRYKLSDPNDREEREILIDKPYPLIAYNRLVSEVGLQSKIIIQCEQNTDWNIRDMVAEIDALKNTYMDVNSELYKLREVDPDCYRKTLNRIYRFISLYRPYIWDLKTTAKHGSEYDT